jgi:hypothetical protein
MLKNYEMWIKVNYFLVLLFVFRIFSSSQAFCNQSKTRSMKSLSLSLSPYYFAV